MGNECKDVYFKYSDSINIFPGSYQIYFKNENLFGNEYIVLQTIDKTYFKNCTTEFIDNLYINAFNSILIKKRDAFGKHLHKEISRYQFAINIINVKNDKYTFTNI
eukprot:273817_1